MKQELPKHKKIILFDGVCNLCNSSINYIIDHDKKDVFRFVALQSDLGKKIQTHLGISPVNLDSIILYIPSKAYYVKSTAALKIAQNFKGAWKFSCIFYLIPTFIRDYIYNFIAKNRYKWYGKQDNCRVPTVELQEKFLDIN